MTVGPKRSDLAQDREAGDRRSASRLALGAEVTLASNTQFFTGPADDVSTAGIFVATHRQLPIGCAVVMQIALPEGEVFAKGHVRSVRDGSGGAPAGLGITFDRPLEAQDAAHIERFCAVRERSLREDE